jgi:hypothetical protein
MADAAELKAMCGNASVGWSKEATRQSHALDLEPGIFKSDNPMRIAASLLQSSQRSMRRKRSAYVSAMAMLCFYINRAGAVTARKDGAPAAVQAAMANVAGLGASSCGGGLIQTTSG